MILCCYPSPSVRRLLGRFSIIGSRPSSLHSMTMPTSAPLALRCIFRPLVSACFFPVSYGLASRYVVTFLCRISLPPVLSALHCLAHSQKAVRVRAVSQHLIPFLSAASLRFTFSSAPCQWRCARRLGSVSLQYVAITLIRQMSAVRNARCAPSASSRRACSFVRGTFGMHAAREIFLGIRSCCCELSV